MDKAIETVSNAGIAEVIAALKIKPSEIRMDISVKDDGEPRAWLEFHYTNFCDKIRKLGVRMEEIAKDVCQAGGVVTWFTFGQISGIEPENAAGNYDPAGKWRAVQIVAKVSVDLTPASRRWILAKLKGA